MYEIHEIRTLSRIPKVYRHPLNEFTLASPRHNISSFSESPSFPVPTFLYKFSASSEAGGSRIYCRTLHFGYWCALHLRRTKYGTVLLDGRTFLRTSGQRYAQTCAEDTVIARGASFSLCLISVHTSSGCRYPLSIHRQTTPNKHNVVPRNPRNKYESYSDRVHPSQAHGAHNPPGQPHTPLNHPRSSQTPHTK